MPKARREPSLAEKHARARAFALSGHLSKFQLTKKKRQEEELGLQSRTGRGAKRGGKSKAKNKEIGMKGTGVAEKTFNHAKAEGDFSASAALPVLSNSSTVSMSSHEDPASDPLLCFTSEATDADPFLLITASADDSAITDPTPRTSTAPEEDTADWQPAAVDRDPSSDWQYVYINKGEFTGKYGYYDNNENEKDAAMIYFGVPLLGDGPHKIPFSFLTKAENPEMTMEDDCHDEGFFSLKTAI